MRAWRQGSVRSHTVYDGDTPLYEVNSTGTPTVLNVFGGDGLQARQATSSTTHYLFDPQGSVAQRLDGSQAILNSSLFDAYGAESATTTPTDPFGFNAQSGYLLDRDTGLYLCEHRYYDVATGRWVTRDPIGYSGGMNMYGYTEGSPIDNFDNTGLYRMYITIGRDGRGYGRLFADPGDVIGADDSGKLTYSIRGGELVDTFLVSNHVPHPRGNPKRISSGGPFPDGTYRISKIGHGRKMGPNWFSLKDPPASLRGTWFHSGRNENWDKRTGGCVRGKESDLNVLTTLWKLRRSRGDGTITVKHVADLVTIP